MTTWNSPKLVMLSGAYHSEGKTPTAVKEGVKSTHLPTSTYVTVQVKNNVYVS